MLSLRTTVLCLAALTASPIVASPLAEAGLTKRSNLDNFSFWLARIINDGNAATQLFIADGKNNQDTFLLAIAISSETSDDISRIIPNTSGTPKFSNDICSGTIALVEGPLINAVSGIYAESLILKSKFQSTGNYNAQKTTLNNIRNNLASWQPALCNDQCSQYQTRCNNAFNKGISNIDSANKGF